MKGFLLIYSLLLLAGKPLHGAVFSGRVADVRSQPVPYATVYIHEISTGIAADIDGRFRISLDKGKYTVEVSSLGYKRSKFEIEIGSSNLERSITLEEEVYTLGDVYFKAGRENRAYHVMRQAIAKAPYHRRQVRDYSSQVYMKGSVKITKLPAVLKLQAGKKKTNLMLNKTFVLESKSRIDFSWPDNYEETILAFSSTIPAEIGASDISAVNTSSVYDREFYGKLSPLSPEAFGYYNFVYEGISQDGGRVVNKIRIIPKKGDSKLVSGHIYIADDLWNVTYARFLIRETGIDIDLKVNYNEASPEIMLPTSYAMDVNVSLMGVRATGFYNSSVTYSSVNRSGESAVVAEAVPQNVINSAREARSFARKSVKMIEDEVAKAVQERDSLVHEGDNTRKSSDLEIKRVSNITRKVDSMATKRDSTYWSSVRMVPLREEEVIAYIEADSLKEEYKRVFEEDSVSRINRSTGNIIFDRILYDSRYKVGKNLTLGYGGLSRVVGGFTFTDGYWLGQNFYSAYRFSKHCNLVVEPSLYYSSYRQKLMWRVDASLSHSPLRLGRAFVSAGEFSRDISNNSSISDFVGSYASFLFGTNPKKYLNYRWITVGNNMDVANGLNTGIFFTWSQVTPLESGNVKSVSGKTGGSNLPRNVYGAVPRLHSNLEYLLRVSYTPRLYYRIVNGRKEYVRTAWPTFAASFKGSLPHNDQAYAKWGSASFSIAQRLRTGIYSQFVYGAEFGKFYNTDRIFFDNFQHFRASDIMVTEKGFREDLLLADSYLYSTNNEWVKYNAEYRSNYIILNHLPFLNSALYTESLYFKGLWLPDKGVVYNEAGYSFGIQGTLRAGLFTAFEGKKYIGTGFRLEIPFLSDIYR